jgi:hypothetical protein
MQWRIAVPFGKCRSDLTILEKIVFPEEMLYTVPLARIEKKIESRRNRRIDKK